MATSTTSTTSTTSITSKTLRGARVALLEARMSGELANLVRRFGGEPLSAPAVREVPLPCDDEVNAFVAALRDRRVSIVVFLTGVGATALFTEAERLGLGGELDAWLRANPVVCRGPKPTAALKKRGLKPTYAAESPFTGNELLAAMEPLALSGTGVGLVHYGERSAAIAEGLRTRGAVLHELCLYEWQLPENTEPLIQIAKRLAAGDVDAVAFTSQIQVRNLFEIARSLGIDEALRASLGARVIVASVGPTCTAAAVALGVRVDVEPVSPKMGPMLEALAAEIEARALNPAIEGRP